ncbi:MAG: anthranilate synthase component II [Bacteroidia bacterium]
MLLLLDNYDSFTYNLYDYFLQCGAQVEVVRNDHLNLDSVLERYQGIVISPGPGTPTNAGCTLDIISRFKNELPIFGVCLGMQAIGVHFGAQLVRASYPMHGKESIISYEEDHPLFLDILKPLKVCRYHSLILEIASDSPLEVISRTKSNEVMALAHKTLPLWGVQFHPEAILTTQGLQLIKNWLTCHELVDTK